MTAQITAADLLASPSLYVQQLDANREVLFLVRLDEARYRAASFLDDRILEGVEKIGWVPFAVVEQVAPHVRKVPLHFIFHAGHVGSTLLSRLLDEVPGVLGIREPLPLRSLAEMNDGAGGAPLSAARVLNLLQFIWSRGFADTQTVIVKATSTAGRIAPEVVEAAAGAKAVYLNLRAEPYIATLLGGANTVSDLEGHTTERLARLKRILGVDADAEGTLSIGEGAAVAWLAERLSQSRAATVLGARLLELDFEAFLDDMEGSLARVLPHFSLDAALAPKLAKSPVLTRYAKLPDSHAYSAQTRRDVLARARREMSDEIGRGLALLDRLARQHAGVAGLLG